MNDNKISGGFKALTIYPNLKQLALENNPISDIKELEPLVLRSGLYE
jgi:Leucine-rich repeat (LRR) protein